MFNVTIRNIGSFFFLSPPLPPLLLLILLLHAHIHIDCSV
jgi:hypothetical protein